MVPAVIPLLLLLIPAMLATLSVVREKDLGSIINFYVTPTTRLEFLLGKQLPYVVLGMLNFLLMTALAVTIFRVPMKGDFLAAAAAALLYVGLHHRDRAVRLDLDAHPGGGFVRDGRHHIDPRLEFLRPHRPGFLAGGLRSSDRGDLPHRVLHHDLPRHLFQGAGFCRPVRRRSSPC